MSLRGVWFGAAEMEIRERDLSPHVCEDGVVVLQGSMVRLTCRDCYEG
jgi:hypothetical protein